MQRVWPKKAITVLAILLVAVALVYGVPRNQNPHLESLVAVDPEIGCQDDTIRRGELAAAGDLALPFLRAQLRRGPGPGIRLLRWLDGAGRMEWIRERVSDSVANSLVGRLEAYEETNRQAVQALLLLGPAAEPARPELTRLVASRDPSLQWMATAALAALSPTQPATISNYVAILRGNSQPGRYFLAREFPRVWPQAPPHLNELISLLDDANASVRTAAARSLAQYGAAASNAVPQLVGRLTESDRLFTPAAAYALGNIAPAHAEEVVKVLLDQPPTLGSWATDNAYRLYAQLGPAAHAAVPSLRHNLNDALRHGFPGPSAFALWRVTREASPEVVTGLTRGAAQREIQRFQLMSLEGLREIGPPASNAIPVLRRLLLDRHRTIQKCAEDALKAITDGRSRN